MGIFMHGYACMLPQQVCGKFARGAGMDRESWRKLRGWRMATI